MIICYDEYHTLTFYITAFAYFILSPLHIVFFYTSLRTHYLIKNIYIHFVVEIDERVNRSYSQRNASFPFHVLTLLVIPTFYRSVAAAATSIDLVLAAILAHSQASSGGKLSFFAAASHQLNASTLNIRAATVSAGRSAHHPPGAAPPRIPPPSPCHQYTSYPFPASFLLLLLPAAETVLLARLFKE